MERRFLLNFPFNHSNVLVKALSMKSTVVSSNDSSVESINSCPPNFTVPSVHFSNQHFDIPHSSVPISNVPNSHEIIVSHANDHRIPTLNIPISSVGVNPTVI